MLVGMYKKRGRNPCRSRQTQTKWKSLVKKDLLEWFLFDIPTAQKDWFISFLYSQST